MKKYFCDRCGAEIVPGTAHWMKLKAFTQTYIFFTPIGEIRDKECLKEICLDCQNEFYGWWNNPPERENK